ncbi:FAS1-like dehydratase domain-containing protein [Thermoactinomyces mirandus]|uniref:MaoC family dehydratase N-terminal domain-containing protein n=1 Tax=Thermoactinomyces mirandus TaxID=2756294 RepID=A0A7W1XR09_9BACL|nr:MaoC family dehydratase N-terminal domain-containing protein [Thermoactinomyces mirandus]MBA4601606.1 MaoC family dehydratase N-terminal domain-containing protein [Thermoactinomyces mirandus]
MDFGKITASGKDWSQIQAGDRVEVKRKVILRDIFAYLGAADDYNPIYLKESYAAQTGYGQVIVPAGLIVSWLSALISTELPGPGSVMKEMRISFPETFHPEKEIFLLLKVSHKCQTDKTITLQALVTGNQRTIAEGEIVVLPPQPLRPIFHNVFDNF